VLGRVTPARSPIRRLNREEYAATIRDLLDIQMTSAKLSRDGAGGEGFDNAPNAVPFPLFRKVHASRQIRHGFRG